MALSVLGGPSDLLAGSPYAGPAGGSSPSVIQGNLDEASLLALGGGVPGGGLAGAGDAFQPSAGLDLAAVSPFGQNLAGGLGEAFGGCACQG